MERFWRGAAWILNSLGIAALVVGIWLAPNNLAKADDKKCLGDSTCNNGCTITVGGGCSGDCKQSTDPTNCGTCSCVLNSDSTACLCSAPAGGGGGG